jgi:hypothetical protein
VDDIPSQPRRWDRLNGLFVVPTLSFRLLFGLLILCHSRRQILGLGVTAHPSPNGWPNNNANGITIEAWFWSGIKIDRKSCGRLNGRCHILFTVIHAEKILAGFWFGLRLMGLIDCDGVENAI